MLFRSNDLIVDEFNPVKAVELLTANGWALKEVALNDDGSIIKNETKDDKTTPTSDVRKEQVLVKKDTALVINLTTVNQPDSVKLVNLIKSQWEQIGVKVNTKIIDRKKFSKETLPNRDYEALAYGGILGYDGDPFPFWHSTQREFPGVNLSNYVNRKVDALIEEARQTSDIKVREEKYAAFLKLVTKDRPAIFLYSPTYSYPVSNEIKGIQISRINRPSDRFWNINEWYTKTKRIFK